MNSLQARKRLLDFRSIYSCSDRLSVLTVGKRGAAFPTSCQNHLRKRVAFEVRPNAIRVIRTVATITITEDHPLTQVVPTSGAYPVASAAVDDKVRLAS
jgi:hypothetical protein